jgi:hypothetical protein
MPASGDFAMLHRTGNVRRLQAIGSEVESNEIRLLRLMRRLAVKAGTADGGARTGFRWRLVRHISCGVIRRSTSYPVSAADHTTAT